MICQNSCQSDKNIFSRLPRSPPKRGNYESILLLSFWSGCLRAPVHMDGSWKCKHLKNNADPLQESVKLVLDKSYKSFDRLNNFPATFPIISKLSHDLRIAKKCRVFSPTTSWFLLWVEVVVKNKISLGLFFMVKNSIISWQFKCKFNHQDPADIIYCSCIFKLLLFLAFLLAFFVDFTIFYTF